MKRYRYFQNALGGFCVEGPGVEAGDFICDNVEQAAKLCRCFESAFIRGKIFKLNQIEDILNDAM